MLTLKRLALAGTIALSASCWADPGISDTSITLGMSAPFSGPNAAYGEDMRQTIQAYFEQINKSGGVNGRKLQLVCA
jgi:branched-chain amino acid transport system substrate-binding protein